MVKCFRLLWRNVNTVGKDRKCFKKVRKTSGLSVKANTNASECTRLRITRCAHSLSTTYLGLYSGVYGWSLQPLWTSKSSCSYQKHCYQQKPADCLHLMILEADLQLLVLRRWNLFDENCDKVQYLIVIVATKDTTYEFLRGVLHGKHDRSHLAMVFFTLIAIFRKLWLFFTCSRHGNSKTTSV